MSARKLTNMLRTAFLVVIAGALYLGLAAKARNASQPTRTSAAVRAGVPTATIDLATVDGVNMVKGQWRYSDTRIVEVNFVGPGADKQPTGAAVKTYDYTPHAGGADFDDSKWELIAPTTLDQRRGSGRLGFNWYRIKLTIPGRVGDYDPNGSTAAFETSLARYAGTWV